MDAADRLGMSGCGLPRKVFTVNSVTDLVARRRSWVCVFALWGGAFLPGYVSKISRLQLSPKAPKFVIPESSAHVDNPLPVELIETPYHITLREVVNLATPDVLRHTTVGELGKDKQPVPPTYSHLFCGLYLTPFESNVNMHTV